MTIEDVWFTVPVCVKVDTENETVVSVTVIDESAQLDEEFMSPSSPEAVAVATGDAEWPEWRFGF